MPLADAFGLIDLLEQAQEGTRHDGEVEIVVERVDRALARCRAERADGVAVEFVMHDHPGRLPHDLCHFAIESALGLGDGFWPLLDRGAMFEGVSRAGGSGKSRPARRLIQRRRRQLNAVEVLVAALTGCWETGDQVVSIAGLTDQDVQRCVTALQDLDARWQEVPIGGTLDLEWPATGSTTAMAADVGNEV